MPDKNLPPEDLPPAAQWLLEQAAADKPDRTQPQVTYTPLAEREARIVGGLRGNARLTEGLDGAAAEVLLAWGDDLGRLIVADTAGLDDATAEGLLQERVRAARRLLLWVNHSLGQTAEETNLAEALAVAGVVYGERRAPAAPPPLVRVNYGPDISPAEQIHLLRRLVEARHFPARDEGATLG